MAFVDDLKAVLAQVGKGTGEVVAKLADLEALLSSLQVMVSENADAKVQLDEAQVVLAALKVAAKALDDVVADAPAEG